MFVFYNNLITILFLGSILNASSPFISSVEKKRLMRPDIDYLLDTDFDYKCPKYVIDVMEDCWAELPDHRYLPIGTSIGIRVKYCIFMNQSPFKYNLFQT